MEPEDQKRSRAMQALATTCEAIAQGRFEAVDFLFEIVGDETVPDDVRALAETFGSMVVQVEAREFHSQQLIGDLRETQRQLEAAEKQLRRENADLKQKLKKLDVQYDEAQASVEIREIVDTDYFRELQSRAKMLRSKFKPQGE
jgi:predicted RNase H-like nuclease (RuvC/YqgF family)